MVRVVGTLIPRVRFFGLFFAFAVGLTAQASTKLVLIGGGYPVRPLERFADCAGGEKGRLLIVPWANEDSDGSEVISERVKSSSWEMAPGVQDLQTQEEKFREQVTAATGIFFTGGSPTRLMDTIEQRGFAPLFQERFRSGICFGGTSAGMAIMPETMMTGAGNAFVIGPEGVETRLGLGLLPGVLVDQHFLRRRRENRLFSLILYRSEPVALGIDENAGVFIEDRKAEVLGEKPVMVIRKEPPSERLSVEILHEGDRFEL